MTSEKHFITFADRTLVIDRYQSSSEQEGLSLQQAKFALKKFVRMRIQDLEDALERIDRLTPEDLATGGNVVPLDAGLFQFEQTGRTDTTSGIRTNTKRTAAETAEQED